MLSCPYRFHGTHGPVTAFAGAVPGWWLNRTPLPAGGEYILFDAGASSAEEAREMGLSVGQRGVPATGSELLHGTRLMAHGLDCRLNSFMLMELASFLSRHKKDLKYHVTLLSSSREEIGLAGATVYCDKNRPKLAIVIDCTLDTVQLNDLPPREENGRLTRQAMGKGPVIFTHDKVFYQPITAQLLQLAEEYRIPFQKDATFPPGLANFVPVKLYGGAGRLPGAAHPLHAFPPGTGGPERREIHAGPAGPFPVHSSHRGSESSGRAGKTTAVTSLPGKRICSRQQSA